MDMLPIAQRAKDLRKRSGKTPHELADAAGMTDACYYDLESYHDEWYTSISLRSCKKLCDQLGVSMADLYSQGGAAPPSAERHDWSSLRDRIRHHVAATGTTLAEFEENVGWDLQDFMRDVDAAWEWNIDCLRDVCAGLGIEWEQFLPDH